MIEVELYAAPHAAEWDTFVGDAKNGVFLFRRAYMDYHADRFVDHSLLFREGDELVAVLPAHLDGDALVSHEGLTFGGLVYGYWMKAETMLRVVEGLVAYARAVGARRIIYRPVPHIYHLVPAEEDLYALWRAGAQLARRYVSFTVDQQGRGRYRELEAAAERSSNSRQRNRARNLRRARSAGVAVSPSSDERDFRAFHSILSGVLTAVYGAAPVHTADELCLLASRFPGAIKIYLAQAAGEILAGAIVYESNDNVAHVQYSANSEAGRKIRALDLIFEELVSEVYRDRRYVDFGTSVEDGGRTLNATLAAYKESQGARAVSYDGYELTL